MAQQFTINQMGMQMQNMQLTINYLSTVINQRQQPALPSVLPSDQPANPPDKKEGN